MLDFVLNGQAHGNVAGQLLNSNFDTGYMRPYLGVNNRSFITENAGAANERVLVSNAPATLRKDEWQILDTVVIDAAKERLRAVADLRAAGLVMNIPNGMAKTVLQTQTQGDINPASVSMDGLAEQPRDRPIYDLANLPLPIIHKDFSFSAREIAASRNGGVPLDTSMAGLAARRVAEEAELMTLGLSSANDQYAYGGGTIYGYTDHPNRITSTITDPTVGGWLPSVLVDEVIGLTTSAKNAKHYGPYRLYCGLAWDKYMDADYSANKGDNTLRDRLGRIEGIQGVNTLDHLAGFDLVLVQMTSDVVRSVIGLDFVTVQWETQGGLSQHFKVMAIIVPQLRSDANNNMGLVHATV